MGNILYVIAVLLIIFWAIAFFAYAIGGLIHILLALALVFFLMKVFSGKKAV